jgi:anti-sigma B factor antagonist
MADSWRVSRLDVDVSYEKGIPIVKAKGECDLITSRKLKETVDELLASGHCKMIFDMQDVAYSDSAGFRVLLEARNKAVAKSGNIVLVSMKPPVERAFSLLRLGELIIHAKSVEEALEVLSNIECTRDSKP